MKKRVFSIVLAVGVLHSQSVLHAQASAAAQASPWFGRIAALGAFYHSSATIATNGQLLPGATATVSNNQTATAEFKKLSPVERKMITGFGWKFVCCRLKWMVWTIGMFHFE